MAGPFFVDDAGNDGTGLSWAEAETSINLLDAAQAFASNEIVYFGADMQCQATNSANLTITGPTAGNPTVFISSTVGSGTTVSYSASTTKQIDTTEGAYQIIFDGAFALWGMSIAAGGNISFRSDENEGFYAYESRFAPPANGRIFIRSARHVFDKCVIDLTADATTNRSANLFGGEAYGGHHEFRDLTFVNPGYRTGSLVEVSGYTGIYFFSGCDFSGFTQIAELVNESLYGSKFTFNNCLLPSTWTLLAGNVYGEGSEVTAINIGPADAPTALYYTSNFGSIVSTVDIYRTGGATIETIANAWLVTSITRATESTPLYTPWIYGEIASTGSKTFDLYITNDTADFTDAEVWLEVEYLGTADEAQSTLSLADRRASITATAAAQTDDTTSTWNGTGPSFTYKQKLSVTATVSEAGMYRARVAVGTGVIVGSRYFYIDPKVTVS